MTPVDEKSIRIGIVCGASGVQLVLTAIHLLTCPVMGLKVYFYFLYIVYRSDTWIGLTYSGGWTWQDSTPLSWSLWGQSEPSSLSGCVVNDWNLNSMWRVKTCSEHRPYICQWQGKRKILMNI